MTEQAERKVHRSPNHPFFDLEEAVAKIKIIYEKEKRSATAPEVIVKHLGYGALNGPGGRTLSGLRQYGLLEETTGRYKISDDAFAMLHYSPESEQRKTALRRAALSPTLYSELYALFPDLAASDETYREELLDRNFNPEVIPRVINNFRSTIQFAGLLDGSYADPEEETKMQTPPLNPGVTPFKPPAASVAGLQTYAFALSPDARAELSLRGTITPDDLELLRQHIDLTIRGLSKLEERTRRQKERIAVEVQFLCPGSKVRFEDHGNCIWFQVTKDAIDLISYSGDYPVSFYEGLDDKTLRERIQHLGGGKFK